MEEKMIKYEEVPAQYICCMAEECPLKSTCLRSLAWQALPADVYSVHVLNPSRAVGKKDCPDYRDSAPVMYAIGFTGMQKKMYPDQYASFKSKLIGKFGRTSFFDRRCGTRAMPPAEQKIVRAVLKAVGVPVDLEFDKYEERYLW